MRKRKKNTESKKTTITKDLLKTRNVFLDASIFEEQNFAHSTKIHSFFYYGKIGVINIYVTTISKMELFNRIEKRIEESKSELNQLNRKYNKKETRIIKNLGLFESIDIPRLDVKKHSAEIKKKIETIFLNSKVQTIQTKNIPLSELVSNYYKRKPPFHNSGKQNEFIDAFILKTLEMWCESNETLMYVISKDPDILGYKSDFLIILEDLSILLENISKTYGRTLKTYNVEEIEKLIEKNRKGLEQLSQDIIKGKVTVRSKEYDVWDFEIIENKLASYRVISVREDRTEVECIFKTNLSFFTFEITDFIEQFPKKSTFEIEVTLYIEIKDGKVTGIKQMIEDSDYVFVQK